MQKSDIKEHQIKTSAAALINVDNKDQAKKNKLKRDSNITVL